MYRYVCVPHVSLQPIFKQLSTLHHLAIRGIHENNGYLGPLYMYWLTWKYVCSTVKDSECGSFCACVFSPVCVCVCVCMTCVHYQTSIILFILQEMTTPRIPGSKIAAAKSSTTNKPRRRRQYRVRGCFIDIMNNKHFNVNFLS